ncbi:MAG TPA: hypothetical protein VIC33_02430 [Vicinamibacterales bacterium]|jgi:hypothetical protein
MRDRCEAGAVARTVASMLVLGALTVAGASAQSLADVARHEKAREQTTTAHGRLYTNADLPAPDTSKDTAQPPSGSAPSADAASKPADSTTAAPDQAKASGGEDGAAKSDDKGATHDRAYWQKRMAEAIATRDQAQLLVDAMQSRINALTADFAARDDPAQRARIGQDRDRAVTELGRLKKVLKSAVQGIADLQDQARREGVPPGWLRG